MASCSNGSTQMADPDYIKFLLNPDLPYEYYFEVGNEKQAPVEKIGVVSKMLAAHSEVFRAQFQHSLLNEKNTESINDTYPDTFRHLLRFVYGFDTTASMSFEDADNLLYVADRFIMPSLKNKLSTRLLHLLDYTNVCSLLSNPACFTVLELKAEITRILQFQTDLVFRSDQFYDCCADVFVRILEQEQLNETELDVWLTAVGWAMNKVEPEIYGDSLRKELEKPLAHIRLCTLTIDDFCQFVAPTEILTEVEIAAICIAHGTKRPHTLTKINNNMTPRTVTNKNLQYQTSEEKNAPVTCLKQVAKKTRFTLTTHEKGIKLIAFYLTFFNSEEMFNFKVTIEPAGKEIPTISKTCKGDLVNPHFVQVSFSADDLAILQPFSQYKITLECDQNLLLSRVPSIVESIDTEFTITNESIEEENTFGNTVAVIKYQTMTPIQTV